MGLNSINTNVAAYYAQHNIGMASSRASSSIARLSSGNRIVRAADDVAAMSAGTSLKTNVTTLRMALINTSQGSSLLQVADGALSQVTDILQRQKAIAVQAGAGSLRNQERSFLNQEFQNLTQEIDRLAGQTNFNGVNLLDGVLTQTVAATDNTATATQAEASISFSINNTGTQTIILNGVTFTGIASGTPTAAEFLTGSTTAETVQNLANQLNASTNTAISVATYTADGNTLRIKAKAGGVLGQDYQVSGLGTWTATKDAASISGPDSGSFIEVFKVALGSVSATTSATAATSTSAIPFQTGYVIKAKIGAGTDYTIATMTTGESLNDLINEINAGNTTHGMTAYLTGTSGNYNIALSHRDPELLAGTTGDVTVTLTGTAKDNAGAAAAATASTSTVHYRGITGLGGGGTSGLGSGTTVGIGTIGNNVLTDQNQTISSVQVIFPPITAANLATTLAPSGTPLSIDIGDPAGSTGEFQRFTFTTNSVANSAPTEISIGATLEETLDNAVAAINSYVGYGSANFDLNQIQARRDGNTLILETLKVGDGVHLDVAGTATALDINLNNTPTGVSLTNNGTLDNGTTTGVTTIGLNNKDFVGQISGFNATYTGTADTVNLEVTVGDYSYTALSVDTTATTATTVRFSSTTGGGYFDVELRANAGTAVTSQAEANTFAARLDSAFATLDFYQNRNVSSYNGVNPIVTDGEVTGSLLGTSVKMSSNDFTDVKIEEINVTAPAGSSSNGSISITVNGEEYTSASNIGSTLGAYQTYKLTSASDANKFIEFTTGSSTIDFGSAAKATSFEDALKEAFGVGSNNGALKFQVGVTTEDTLSVSIDGVSTDDLNISTLDVLTQASAAAAADAIDAAIDIVTSVRATVGALQSRFDYAAANVESSIQNQDAARGVLLDTDIAAESSAFAQAQVQLQAGISVLAQANQLPQSLLKLIG